MIIGILLDGFYITELKFITAYFSIGTIEAMRQNVGFAFCRIFVSLR